MITQDQQELAERGEAVIFPELCKKWNWIPVNRIDSPDWQLTCGDWLIQTVDSEGTHTNAFVDVKTEATYTGNLFVETYSNYPEREGWLTHLEDCDYIVFIFEDTRQYVGVLLPLFREFIEATKQRYKVSQVKHYLEGGQLNDTRGLLVPINAIPNTICWQGTY